MVRLLVRRIAQIVPVPMKAALRQLATGFRVRSLRLRFRAHTYIGKYPYLLFPLYSVFNIYQNYAVSSQTQLVIEGFPRSGTTFCCYAFLQAQSYPVKLAFHVHLPAQVIRALKLGIPTLVLIRHPKEAISSAVVREPWMSLKALLERYLIFYRTLERYRAQFVIADFHEATSDFGHVIERLNNKFGTSFKIFESTKDNLAEVRQALQRQDIAYGGHGLLDSYNPNFVKELAKNRVDFSAERALLKQCEQLYHHYVDKGDVAPELGAPS